MCDDEGRRVEAWVNAMNLRGVFARRSSEDKAMVELNTAREFANSSAATFDHSITIIASCADDPPDVHAEIGGHAVSLELAEFVKQEVREKRTQLGSGYRGEFEEQQWTHQAFEKHLNDLLDKKQDRCARKGCIADALVIHSDECFLLPRHVADWLSDSSFAPRRNIRSAYFLMFYDPLYRRDCWPLFTIYGDLWA